MGSVSAMNSIDRIIEKHGDEIKKRYLEQAGTPLVEGVELGNDIYAVQVTWKLVGDAELEGPSIDIDTLADEFPDCEVGY